MTSIIDFSNVPQGDVALLRHPAAQRLLTGNSLARLAWVAKDGTPRVIPMGYVWNDGRIVMTTINGSSKLAALQKHPDVAITIDTAGPPPDVLLIRGRAELTDTGTVPPEYEQMQAKYYGAEQTAEHIAMYRQAGVQMTLIVVEPRWVGVLDFQTRVPGAVLDAVSG
jgi:general stress protein 26